MKKIFFLILFVALMIPGFSRRLPRNINYQMVVRNANNELVVNQDSIVLTVSFLDGVNGPVFYAEQHTLATNRNGLAACCLGQGTRIDGRFSDIVWERACLKSELAIPGDTTVTNVTSLDMMPHALFADNVAPQYLSQFLVSRHYADSAMTAAMMQDVLDSFPTRVSAYNNDSGYLTSFTETQSLSIVGDTVYLTNGGSVVLPADFSGDYLDLQNAPHIADKTSDLVNDAHFITANDVPDSVSAFRNDAGYLVWADVTAFVDSVAAMKAEYDSLAALIALFSQQIDSLKPVVNNLYDGLPCPEARTVTDFDGNVYNTVKIGTQCWIKENLRSTHFPDGRAIAASDTLSDTVAYRYFPAARMPFDFSDTADFLKKYGYLYNFTAVADTVVIPDSSETFTMQGICPDGWHIPSVTELATLSQHILDLTDGCGGGRWHIAKMLAAKEGWETSGRLDPCCVGYDLSTNNRFGFSALPAGSRSINSDSGFGIAFHFWTTAQISGRILVMDINYSRTMLSALAFEKSYATSVRCVKD